MKAGLTPEFEDGVKTFREWAKGQRGHMDGDKIRRPCRKCKNTKFGTPDEVSYHLCMRGFMLEYYNWTSHSEESVQDYFKALTVPPVLEERTPAGLVEIHIVTDGSYDYDESGSTDHFYNIVHAANHPLWDGCTQSQLGVVAEMVDIKADGHISERIYNRISQWNNRTLPPDHTLLGDYYSTNRLVNDLDLSIEKINACKNGCMLYWKDDVDLEYCKFCGDARYQLSHGRDPH
ncbi:UNVERIFIED_CONTAM: hypothetical protein Sradi_6134000 [Sesamum radiatum]|uniref:Transposase-associated domain-containing protein n=1 Tax=Sesamum radiatum TaxID=300843 RepID=A0AAW2KL67_SESRA